ncbi:MAG: DUF5683 domain-containing protein [Bacteroidota bacterium]
MNRILQIIFCVAVLLFSANITKAQKAAKDTVLTNVKSTVQDSTNKSTPRKHIPRIATIRSAICPGLGQIYNREYWKLPIVYGALAIPTYTFFYNDHYYKIIKYAYEIRYRQAVDTSFHPDESSIDPEVRNLKDLNSLLKYRNSFRRDRDYSIMWFVIVWGLNVVDATVFAHLKEFSVSDNLALKVEPKIMPAGLFALSSGVGFTLSYKNSVKKKVEVR